MRPSPDVPFPSSDCYCTPAGKFRLSKASLDHLTDRNSRVVGFYTPGKYSKYRLIQGTDSSNIAYGGIVMSDTHPTTGQLMEQYWFLRDGETGLHMFSRLAYHNETTPFLRNLQEMRTLFRPNTTLWTHLSSSSDFYAPSPLPNPASTGTGVATVVQDATWYLGARPNDPYVQQTSDYFTKYTFQETWRDHDAHGLFADGSTSPDGSTYGAWQVMNTKDTYFGGPTHSDLVVVR
jgi:rhamnogalacturonan endolyase